MDEGIKQLLIVAIAVIVGIVIINFVNGGFNTAITKGISDAIGQITSAVSAAAGAGGGG